MIDDIKEASPSLQKLHEGVVLCLRRRGVVLPRRNIWSYEGSSTDPYVDDIREVLIDVLCEQTELRSSFGSVVPSQLGLMITSLDRLGTISTPALRLLNKHVPTSTASILDVFGRVAAVRVALLDLVELLNWLVPGPATAKTADEQLRTLLACRLKRVGVPLDYIADLIGDFDEIDPDARDTSSLDAQDKKSGALQRRVHRFERVPPAMSDTASQQQDAISSAKCRLPEAVRELRKAVIRHQRRCSTTHAQGHLHADRATASELDTIRAQLALLLRDYTERPFVSGWRADVHRAEELLDQLLPTLGPVLRFVDQCARAKFKPGSRFEPLRLKDVQRKAGSIHVLVEQLADLRIRLSELMRVLDAVLPFPEAVATADQQAKTLFSYRLKTMDVRSHVIADAIGDLEQMPADPLDHKDEREVRVRAVRQRIRRFEETLRADWKTRDRENVSLSCPRRLGRWSHHG